MISDLTFVFTLGAMSYLGYKSKSWYVFLMIILSYLIGYIQALA